jgi:hypothetical protein
MQAVTHQRNGINSSSFLCPILWFTNPSQIPNHYINPTNPTTCKGNPNQLPIVLFLSQSTINTSPYQKQHHQLSKHFTKSINSPSLQFSCFDQIGVLSQKLK